MTPAGRGRSPATDAVPADELAPTDDRSPAERRRSMTRAQRLKRVFNIDVTTCIHCDGALRTMASIEQPNTVRATFGHVARHGALETARYPPSPRAPPAAAAA